MIFKSGKTLGDDFFFSEHDKVRDLGSWLVFRVSPWACIVDKATMMIQDTPFQRKQSIGR